MSGVSVPMQVNVVVSADDVERRAVRQVIHDELAAALESGVFASAAELSRLRLKETLTTAEVEKLYGESARVLENHRVNGTGPRYLAGRPVKYRHRDIQEWQSKRAVRTHDCQ